MIVRLLVLLFTLIDANGKPAPADSLIDWSPARKLDWEDFDPSKSWGRVKNDYILSHEQAHFDIAEIHARLLNKALQNYKFIAKTAKNDIGEIYQQVMDEHHAMQEQYDEETNYSRNETQQKEWQRKITDQLNSLESFSHYK